MTKSPTKTLSVLETDVASVILRPFTYVPLVLPKSSTTSWPFWSSR
jgi:hypothetical protein